MNIPSRKKVIEEFTRDGGRVAAVFPIRYPRELLRAHGFLPVEVWGPPGIDDAPAGAHLQAYTCAIVRQGLAFLLAGGLDVVDAIVVPNDCDSLQGLGSLLIDFIDTKVPVLPLYAPRGKRASDLSYLTWELRGLGDKLEEIGASRPDDATLWEAISREERADDLLARLHRKGVTLALSDMDRYRLIRSREFLPAEEFSTRALEALDNRDESPGRGVPLLISGIVPEPWEIFSAFEEMGASVVADDLACCGRRIYPPGTAEEPWRRMAQRLLGAPPDPMRGSPIEERLEHVRALAQRQGARGVVFYGMKFCEPEQFDLPQLREGLQKSGLPSVSLEVDLNGELSHQAVTRLEAFVEMLR